MRPIASQWPAAGRFAACWHGQCLAALILVAPQAIAAPPAAAPAADMATQLASQAMAAFKAGDHDRAVELYLAAYRQDPTKVVPLFNAARAAHIGLRFGRAEDLYRQVLSHPQASAEKKASAQAYLDEIAEAKAAEAATTARKLAQNGQHAEAAASWRSAYRAAPAHLEWLLAAARASRAAGEKQLAEKDYSEYVQRAPASAEREDARAELQSLRAPPTAAAEPAPKAAQPPPPTAPAPAARPVAVHAVAEPASPREDWPGPAMWGGAVVAVGGGILWLATWRAEQSLQQAVAPGAPPSLTKDQAQERAGVLEGRYRLGIGLAAVGAAAAAVGGWRLWSSAKSSVSVQPAPNGIALVLRQ